MRKSSKLLSILLVFAVFCLCGCTQRGSDSAPEESTPAPVAEVVSTPAPATPAPVEAAPVESVEEPAPAVVSGPANPLTGEPTTEEALALRPFAVQMNNHSDALPQCGISCASIIYEMPEEGITRMTAIYPQNPGCTAIGSVRSARPYHSEIAKTYDAIFVHWGASTRGAQSVYQLHANDDVDFVGNAGAYSYREPSRANRAMEHTGFVTVERLQAFLTDNNRRTTLNEGKDFGLRFSDDVKPSSGKAENMKVFFCSKESDFTYNAAKGTYTMSQYGGIPYVDGNTNEPVEFRNVLFLRANIEDEAGLSSISLLNASGVGTLCVNGQMEHCTWEHGDYSDCFHYYKGDGSELEFGIGRIYICIISYQDNLTIE